VCVVVRHHHLRYPLRAVARRRVGGAVTWRRPSSLAAVAVAVWKWQYPLPPCEQRLAAVT
jgi:hypothetical protein